MSYTMILAFILAYVFGSIPVLFLLVKLRTGIDLRHAGTGNVGISNAVQQAGRTIAGPIIFYEVFVKGAFPVFLASGFVLDLGVATQVGVALGVIAGHNWPVFLRFRGGRGLAPSIGVILALSPLLLVAYGAVAIAIWLVTRNSPVAWLVSMLGLPAWAILLKLPEGLAVFAGLYLVVVVGRRALGNWPGKQAERIPGSTFLRILLNRVVLDRDIASREEWVKRRPGALEEQEVRRS